MVHEVFGPVGWLQGAVGTLPAYDQVYDLSLFVPGKRVDLRWGPTETRRTTGARVLPGVPRV